MDAPAIRLIGCRNCRAAISIEARFCPRCGVATAQTPTTVAQPAAAVSETPSQRRVRMENEVDALADHFYSGQMMAGLALVLGVGGGLCAVTGMSFPLAVLLMVLAAIVFGLDVRRHVKARELAEQRVRGKR